MATTSRGKYPLTELDQKALFSSITKWNDSLDNPASLPAQIRTAFRAMTSGRPGAAHLALPFDTQKAEINPEEIWAEPRHQTFPSERASPEQGAIEEAAQRLLRAKNPVMVCGGGPVIAGAMALVQNLAETLNMVVATTVSGQGVIAETHPNALGVVGSNGGLPATRAVMDRADLVMFVGCRAGSVTTERWSSPDNSVPIIHIDSDPMVLGANYRTEIAICADAYLALDALLKAVKKDKNRADFGGDKIAAMAWSEKLAAFMKLAHSEQTPITPERVIHALSNCLDEDAVVVADPGTPCPIYPHITDGAGPGGILLPIAPMAPLAMRWQPLWVRILGGHRLKQLI